MPEFKHGLAKKDTNGRQHPLYSVWCEMKARCHRPSHQAYPRYGGRGIEVCKEWRDSFPQFLEDMGLPPTGMTLERKENDGPYSKGNCIWATRKAQANNRSTTVFMTLKGVTKPLQEWAVDIGIDQHTLNARRTRYKWSDEKCLTTPLGAKNS